MNLESNVLIVDNNVGIVTLTLNRPEVRNALNETLIVSLIQELDRLETDSTVKLVVINSLGDNFCAGADLNWMQQSLNYDEAANTEDAIILSTLMRKLNSLPKPTVCITQGAVYGGGIGLVACCDISIAIDTTKFCFSEVKLGLAPAVIEPYIVNAIGNKAARRWMLTAEIFDAKQAEQMGLVNQVITAKQLPDVLGKLEQQIRNNGQHACAATKELLIKNLDYNDPHSESFTTRLIAKLRSSREGQEGIRAFLEKRKPNWNNK